MAILYVSTLTMLAVQQERIIFKKRPGFTEHMDIWGTQDIPLRMPWKDGQAEAHLLKKEDSDRVLIFFYGNAHNTSQCLHRLRWLAQHVKCSLFVADYPGYGNTAGEPGQGEIAECFALWSQVLSQKFGLTPEKRLVWGHSLGGAVAAQFVAKEGAQGLILESTFNSMIDMASEIYPFMPMRWLCRHPFDSDQVLQHFKQPILIFHCPKDYVVPFDLGAKLYERLKGFGCPVQFFETQGGHNDGYIESGALMIRQAAKSFPEWFESRLESMD